MTKKILSYDYKQNWGGAGKKSKNLNFFIRKGHPNIYSGLNINIIHCYFTKKWVRVKYWILFVTTETRYSFYFHVGVKR